MSEIMGVFGKIRQEGKAEGMAEGKVKGAREVIIPLLEVYSMEELSGILDMSVFEIREILK